MTINLKEIEQLINAEKNAGGFATLIRDFKKIGVKRYDYLVAEGLYRYYDETSFIDVVFNGKPKIVTKKSLFQVLKMLS